MHIGVLVYGRLNKCVEHYDNILESIGKEHTIDFFLSSDNSSDTLLNDFIKLYNPKAFINTAIQYDYDISNYPNPHPGSKMHNMTCHFINKNRVYSLLEEYIQKENVDYDVIISLRIDTVFENKFKFDLKDNTLYIPEGKDYHGINDQIAYGKIDVMKKYNSINPINLLEKSLSFPNPEHLTLANIQFYNLEVERVNLIHFIER